MSELHQTMIMRAIWLTAACSMMVCGFSPMPIAKNGGLNVVVSTRQFPPMAHVQQHVGALRMGLDDEDEEDDEEEDFANGPLSDGVDSVAWLPTVLGASDVTDPKITQADAEFLPLFPLGGIVYTPNSEHVLNIFEPRYRQMYTDILMNGSKRFVVSMSHPTESGSFAQMGVLFELEELKEVSEQTGDQIKYICNHKVTGRVKLHRVINPSAWDSRETYLRVEGTIIDDSGKDDEEEEKDEALPNDTYGSLAAAASSGFASKLEKSLQESFSALVEIQHDLEEDVRFTRPSVATLAVKDGAGKDGLWQSIKLWQTFADQRLMAQQNELQQEFQERLQAFLKKERGLNEDELPSAIGFEELSEELQAEVQELQKRMQIELQPLVLESTLTMQKILEASDHEARLKLLKYFIENETKRLSTKRALKGMFGGKGSSLDASTSELIPPEERVEEVVKPSKSSSSGNSSTTQQPPSSIFIDEEDAFQ